MTINHTCICVIVFLFYTFIILTIIYNLLKFFSEEEEQHLSSIEHDTMSFTNTISEHDESYVKIHPDRKLIENDVNNLQSGHDICLY